MEGAQGPHLAEHAAALGVEPALLAPVTAAERAGAANRRADVLRQALAGVAADLDIDVGPAGTESAPATTTENN